MKYKYTLLAVFLALLSIGGGYYYINYQANIASEREKKKVSPDSSTSSSSTLNSGSISQSAKKSTTESEPTSASQSTEDSTAQLEETSASQSTEDSTAQLKETSASQSTEDSTAQLEETSTTKYSSCLQVSEPLYQSDGIFWTVKLEVKNNCGVDFNIVKFSFVAKNKKGNIVEEHDDTLKSFYAGNVGSASADFDQNINPDNIGWKITNIQESG